MKEKDSQTELRHWSLVAPQGSVTCPHSTLLIIASSMAPLVRGDSCLQRPVWGLSLHHNHSKSQTVTCYI